MRRWHISLLPAPAVLLIALNLSALRSAAAAELDDTTIQNYEDNHVGWDSGRLTIAIQQAPKGDLVVEFKALRRERMTSLLVHAGQWTLNLSEVVSGIHHTYASRITVTVREWTPARTLFFLDLPFEVERGSGQDVECNGLQLKVLNGKLVDQTTYVEPAERCIY